MLKFIRDLAQQETSLLPCVATIGNFDGLHQGHRHVIEKVVAKARELALMPMVITFEPLPQTFFKPSIPLLRLTSLPQKLALLQQWGVQQVACLRFNHNLSLLSPREFVGKYLIDKFAVRYLMVGEGFRFGHQQAGNVALLQNMATAQFRVEPINVITQNEQKISSTLIREAIISGDLTHATELLGRPFSISQRVTWGAQLGRQLGFATANLRLKKTHHSLKGVFLTQVSINQNKYMAVTNVGTRPTVDGKNALIEAHLLDFSGNLYGQRINIDFLHKIRDEKRFNHIEELKQQITQDIQDARRFIKQAGIQSECEA